MSNFKLARGIWHGIQIYRAFCGETLRDKDLYSNQRYMLFRSIFA